MLPARSDAKLYRTGSVPGPDSGELVIYANVDGSIMDELFLGYFKKAALGSRGLGLLRLEEAFKRMGSLTIKGQGDVKVDTIRPKWWPSEWFLDHQQQKAASS
ncbi:hypothetical protein OROGR_026739 [Orobanche gracilis]